MEKSKEKYNKENFYKIAFIIGVVIIVTIIVILQLPKKEENVALDSEESKIKSDLSNIQKVFTNQIESIKAEYKQSLIIKAGSINSQTNNLKSAKGETVFILDNGVTGRIVFNNLQNLGTDYFLGFELPIYNQDTLWYVDKNGIITLQVGDKTYKSEQEKAESFNENIKIKTNIKSGFDGIKATLDIMITYDKNITSVTINGEEIQGITKDENGNNIIIKEVSKNGNYNIVVLAEDNTVNRSIVNVTQITENIK